jgi:phosphoserine phosphatase RsbU/P
VARQGLGSTLIGAAIAIAGAALAVAMPDLAVRGIGAGAVVLGVLVLVIGRPSPTEPRSVEEEELHALRSELTEVTDQATRLAKGDVVTTGSETEALAAIRQAADKMQAMVEARAHIVATERDLDQARRMYRQILPLQSALEQGSLAVSGSCSPAAETGGDWWTYRKLTGGRVLLVIGDATGHGVHSAMIGCMAHGAVRALTQLGDDFLLPRRVLDAVHTAVKVPGIELAGMTLFSCLIDPKAGNVQYFNYGHVFPLVARRDPSGVIIEVTSITGERDPEEFAEDSIDLEVRSGTCPLPPGAVLVCFTDGLIERAKDHARPFGARRLQQALIGATVPPGVQGLTALRDRILARVDEYADGAPLDDDITLVLAALGHS